MRGEVSPKPKLKHGGQVLETRNHGLRTSGVPVLSVCLASACLPIVKTLYKEKALCTCFQGSQEEDEGENGLEGLLCQERMQAASTT